MRRVHKIILIYELDDDVASVKHTAILKGSSSPFRITEWSNMPRELWTLMLSKSASSSLFKSSNTVHDILNKLSFWKTKLWGQVHVIKRPRHV